MVRKIILIGYMGVGKSVIAQKLSHRLKIDSYDVDDLIEDRLTLKVSEIFKLKGEISFRKAEHEVFKEYIENGEKEKDLASVTDLIIIKTMQYSRKQKKWFERDKRISWIQCDELTYDEIVERALELCN